MNSPRPAPNQRQKTLFEESLYMQVAPDSLGELLGEAKSFLDQVCGPVGRVSYEASRAFLAGDESAEQLRRLDSLLGRLNQTGKYLLEWPGTVAGFEEIGPLYARLKLLRDGRALVTSYSLIDHFDALGGAPLLDPGERFQLLYAIGVRANVCSQGLEFSSRLVEIPSTMTDGLLVCVMPLQQSADKIPLPVWKRGYVNSASLEQAEAIFGADFCGSKQALKRVQGKLWRDAELHAWGLAVARRSCGIELGSIPLCCHWLTLTAEIRKSKVMGANEKQPQFFRNCYRSQGGNLAIGPQAAAGEEFTLGRGDLGNNVRRAMRLLGDAIFGCPDIFAQLALRRASTRS